MKNRARFMGLLVALLVILLVVPGAQAADFSIGGGIGVAPDYEGSEDYELVPVPTGAAMFDNGMFVKLVGLNLRANLIPSKTWRLGPMYNYRPSRSRVDNNRVDRMSNVSDANEIGGFGGFYYNNWFVFLEFLADTGDAHDGWLGTARGGYNHAASKSWRLSFGLSTTYASGGYMSTYFGVDGADAARSGLRTFNADEGLKDIAFDLGIACQFTDHIGGRFIGQYKMLINDADESSPVTNEGSQHQIFGGLLVVYTF